ARGALAVTLQERVVGLGAGAVRTADPVARRARDRLRTAEQPLVHAPERPAAVLRSAAGAEPVGEAVLVLEDQLAEVGDVGEAEPAVRETLRVERRVHGAQERPG